MKYIIYGNNRVAKDFKYIFEHLNILEFVDNINRLIKLITDYHAQIIICDFDKLKRTNDLQKVGLVYGKDFFYEEDFFSQLDNFSIPNDKKIAVWGTGNKCEFFLKHNLPWKVDIFIDSYKKQKIFNDTLVYFPNEIKNWKDYYVIIAVEDNTEICHYLLKHGLIESVDYLSYKKLLELPSILLRQTIFDQAYYELECNTMHNHLEILSNGNTRCCCTTFVSQGLDNIFDKEMDELWNSVLHKILCLSTENKTFSFCDKSMCPLFVTKKRKNCKDILSDNKSYKSIAQYPETLALGYDSSCNLKCITCRKELHFASGKELEIVNKIADKVITEYLTHCKFLILAGSGEVFASPSYRSIYEANICNPQYIRLLSNGILFTPLNWKYFKEKNNAKIMLTVSVDAASKETYQRIRRGDFDTLKQNMKFASELRKKGELSYFRMNFVVQKENYKEMPEFVQWGQEIGVDEIFFTKILNWGTYTPEEFKEVSMMEEDGVTPKSELKEVIKNPIMNSDIVDMGTIQFAHKIDDIGVVKNYYMWELEKRGGKLFS